LKPSCLEFQKDTRELKFGDGGESESERVRGCERVQANVYGTIFINIIMILIFCEKEFE
jgi:hypothetical protein